MKTFISLIAALMILYIGRDTETHVSIVDEPQQGLESPLSKKPTFDIKYQHVRFVGGDIEVVAHDLWDVQVLRLRLPSAVQVGNTLLLDKNSFEYQKFHTYRTLECTLDIQKKQQMADAVCIEGLLNYCVTDGEASFCASKVPIRIMY